MKASRLLLLLSAAALLGACSPKLDAKRLPGDWSGLAKEPMDAVVARLAEGSESWMNGAFVPIELPENASLEPLVGQAFSDRHFTRGQVSDHRILESRSVAFRDGVPPYVYRVLKVRTNLGDMIVLLQYTSQHNWWSRVIEG